MMEEDPLSETEIDAWTAYLESNTTLSSQEAEVFVRLYQQDNDTICESMGIERSHFDQLLHNRISEKLETATITATIGKFLATRVRATTPAIPFGHALIGCAGPHCDEDVETDRTTETFDDFYTKTANRHDDDRLIDNEQQVHFCSLQCLTDYEEFYENCDQSEPIP